VDESVVEEIAGVTKDLVTFIEEDWIGVSINPTVDATMDKDWNPRTGINEGAKLYTSGERNVLLLLATYQLIPSQYAFARGLDVNETILLSVGKLNVIPSVDVNKFKPSFEAPTTTIVSPLYTTLEPSAKSAGFVAFDQEVPFVEYIIGLEADAPTAIKRDPVHTILFAKVSDVETPVHVDKSEE